MGGFYAARFSGGSRSFRNAASASAGIRSIARPRGGPLNPIRKYANFRMLLSATSRSDIITMNVLLSTAQEKSREACSLNKQVDTTSMISRYAAEMPRVKLTLLRCSDFFCTFGGVSLDVSSRLRPSEGRFQTCGDAPLRTDCALPNPSPRSTQ